MKKKNLLLLLVIGFLLLSSRPLDADIGPKPSVTIQVKNPPEGVYYMTLLSKEESFGPWHKIEQSEIDMGDKDEAFVAFANYEDKDGFCFLGNHTNMEGKEEYYWSYYPPEEFKVAVYLEDGTIIVSDIVERQAFDSYFTIDFLERDLGIKEDVRLGRQLFYFLLRVILTILVEYGIAYLMGYRSKKERRVIIIANIITQVILNAVLMFFDYYAGALVWLIMFPIGELAVFIIELVIYLIAMKGHKKWKTFLYTLIANIITAALTLFTTIIQWSN